MRVRNQSCNRLTMADNKFWNIHEHILRPDDFHLVTLLEAKIVRLAWHILV